jgi:hypothetical protein
VAGGGASTCEVRREKIPRNVHREAGVGSQPPPPPLSPFVPFIPPPVMPPAPSPPPPEPQAAAAYLRRGQSYGGGYASTNVIRHGTSGEPDLRERVELVGSWAHTGGGNALAFKQPPNATSRRPSG